MRSTTMPRIGVIGAGAIGCTLAARFAHGGCEVKLAALPDVAVTIRREGVRLTAPGVQINTQVTVVESPSELLDSDYIFISVKQHDLAAAIRYWLPALPPSVTIIPAINGIPWWFFPAEGEGGSVPGDPDNAELVRLLPRSKIVGTAVYLTAYSPAPGAAVQGTRNRLVFGELDGTHSSRLAVLKAACNAVGMDCELSNAIHQDVWMKVVGNAVFNPLSVLSGSDMVGMLADSDISQLALSMVHELFALGQCIGLRIDITPEERLRRAGSAGNAQTSMLQDYLKGRALEVEGLIGAVVKLASQNNIDMPFTKAVYGLVRNASINNPFSTTTRQLAETPT